MPLDRQSALENVPLRVAVEALADVLVGYDVPTNRIIAEFRQTVAAYMDMEAAGV